MSRIISNSRASTNLNTPSGTYIYDIISTSSARLSSPLASITSNSSLTIFDPSTLSIIASIKDTHDDQKGGVTCLRALNENVLVTSGRDGFANLWDLRGGNGTGLSKVGKLCRVANPSRQTPFLSLAASSTYNAVAAGEEYTDYLARVVVWDVRSTSSGPSRQYTESHNDDIMELKFDESSVSNLVLSGSTDGLVNVYDLIAPKREINSHFPAAQTDWKGGKSREQEAEDDEEALYQIINHGSSVHHAGFLPQQSPSRKSLFAISHDEKLAVYKLNNRQDIEKAEEEQAKLDEKCEYGDLRQKINGCDYIVDILMPDGGNSNPLVVAGSNKGDTNWIDIIPFCNKGEGSAMDWDFRFSEGLRLQNAHGEEVVRCVRVFWEAGIIFTSGEDGLVKVWKCPSDTSDSGVVSGKAVENQLRGKERDNREETMDVDEEGEVALEKFEEQPKKKEKIKKDKQRYKPY